jgi:hypothetical protein
MANAWTNAPDERETMNLSIKQAGRKRRVILALGAATLVGGGIFAGTAAADAASTPARPAHQTTYLAPTLTAVKGAPDLAKVKPAQPTKAKGEGCVSTVSPAHPIKPVTGASTVSPAHPIKPVICGEDGGITTAGGPSLVEVPGAAPDMSKVKMATGKPLDLPIHPLGTGTTTARR